MSSIVAMHPFDLGASLPSEVLRYMIEFSVLLLIKE